MPYIEVQVGYCKGCGLCIPVCAKELLALSEDINASGYHTRVVSDMEACTGCCYCALACPESAIEVFMEAKEAGDDR